MSTLLNNAKAGELQFRQAHGDPATWEAVDFEVHQNLALVVSVARRERWRRPLRRLTAGLVVAYATPFYVLAEVIYRARGRVWLPLDHYLDRVDDRLSDAETACSRAGDQRFVEWLGAATDRLTEAVGRLTTRLVRF